MIDVVDAALWWIPGAPLVVGLALWPFARPSTRAAAAGFGLFAVAASLVEAWRALTRIAREGGWSEAASGGWRGARLLAEDPTGRLGIELDPLFAVPCLALAAASFAAFASSIVARGAGPRGEPANAQQLCAQLVAIGAAQAVCLAPGVEVAAGALALASLAAYGALLGGAADRRSVDAANRLFATHRFGDVALLGGLLLVSLSFGSFDVDAIAVHAQGVNPWARAEAGPLAGTAARWTWSLAVALLVVGAGARLSLLPAPSPRDLVGAPAPTSAIVHGVALLGAGGLFFVKIAPLVHLAPEVATVLALVAAATAVAQGLRALVEDRLAAVDVLLVSSYAALVPAAVVVGEWRGAALAAAFVALVHAPLAAATAAVHGATQGEDRLSALGGLWRPLRAADAARALATFAIACFAPFTGALLLLPIAWSALASPRRDPIVLVVVLVAAYVASVAAFRALHLAFSGEAPRAPLARVPRDAPLPARAVAIGAALLASFAGVVLAPREIGAIVDPEFFEPVARFASHGIAAAATTMRLVAPQDAPPVDPALRMPLLAVVAAVGFAGWATSALLWRGGPTRLHARLARVRGVARAAALVGRAEDVEERATETVVQGAVRFSRTLGLALLPLVLEALLQKLPALVAGTVGALLRVVHNGDVQRALALAFVAALAVLAFGGVP